MSRILSSLLLAGTAAAAAQVTTSIWMPSYYEDVEIGYYASVIGKSGDKTTLALVYDDETDTSALEEYDPTPQTVTVGGTTWYEAGLTTTIDDAALTASVACDKAASTCVVSSGGALAWSEMCEDYSTEYLSAYTTTWTTTYSADEFGPATAYTYTETFGGESDEVPSYCTDGTTLPEDVAVTTVDLERGDMSTYQVVITAGQQKLGATAAATPSNTLATITGSSTGPAPTGNVTTATHPLQVSGTGAAPLMTMAPALAGLGAAVAAILL